MERIDENGDNRKLRREAALIKRIFTRNELEELGVPFTKAVIHSEQIDTSRWATDHVAVFRAEPDGPLWQVGYQLPATERQECDRWYGEDPVEAIQVEPHEVTVIEYRPATLRRLQQGEQHNGQ